MHVMRNLLFTILILVNLQSGCQQERSSAKLDLELQQFEPTGEKLSPNDSIRYPLVYSVDGGASWYNARRNLPIDVQVSFIELKGEELLLATDNKGLFLSGNQRREWRQISDPSWTPKINAIALARDSIYAGVYQEGVFLSKDEGKSWHSLNEGLPSLAVQAILPTAKRLWVGTNSGLFFQEKGDSLWRKTEIETQVLSLYLLANKLVGGTSQGTILSEDQGDSWKWIHQAGAVHYTHPIGNRIYELIINGDVNYSDSWGQFWGKTNYAPRAGSYVYEIMAYDTLLLLSNNYGIHRSADFGQHWELIFATESMGFFDLVVVGDTIFGGTRSWDEYRKRK